MYPWKKYQGPRVKLQKYTVLCVCPYINTPYNGKYHQFLKTKLQNYSKFLYQLLKKQRAQGQNYKTTLFFVCMTYIQTLNEREKVSRDQRPNNKTTPIYWMNLWKKSKGTGVKLKTTLFCVYAIYIDTPCDWNGHQFQKDKLQHYS